MSLVFNCECPHSAKHKVFNSQYSGPKKVKRNETDNDTLISFSHIWTTVMIKSLSYSSNFLEFIRQLQDENPDERANRVHKRAGH